MAVLLTLDYATKIFHMFLLKNIHRGRW